LSQSALPTEIKSLPTRFVFGASVLLGKAGHQEDATNTA